MKQERRVITMVPMLVLEQERLQPNGWHVSPSFEWQILAMWAHFSLDETPRLQWGAFYDQRTDCFAIRAILPAEGTPAL